MTLMAEGKSNAGIAADLHLSLRTVEIAHRAHHVETRRRGLRRGSPARAGGSAVPRPGQPEMNAARITVRALAVVVAVASNVAAQVVSADHRRLRAAAAGGRLGDRRSSWSGSTTRSARSSPGGSCRSPSPGWLMVGASFFWAAGAWYPVTRPDGWVWPLVEGVTDLWALLVGILVLVYPTGRLVSRFDRALVIAVLRRLRRAVRRHPAASRRRRGCSAIAPQTCTRCCRAPTPTSGSGVAWRAVGLALMLTVAVRLTMRWFLSTLPARRVAFVMPLAMLLWCYGTVQDSLSFAFGLGERLAAVHPADRDRPHPAGLRRRCALRARPAVARRRPRHRRPRQGRPRAVGDEPGAHAARQLAARVLVGRAAEGLRDLRRRADARRCAARPARALDPRHRLGSGADRAHRARRRPEPGRPAARRRLVGAAALGRQRPAAATAGTHPAGGPGVPAAHRRGGLPGPPAARARPARRLAAAAGLAGDRAPDRHDQGTGGRQRRGRGGPRARIRPAGGRAARTARAGARHPPDRAHRRRPALGDRGARPAQPPSPWR